MNKILRFVLGIIFLFGAIYLSSIYNALFGGSFFGSFSYIIGELSLNLKTIIFVFIVTFAFYAFILPNRPKKSLMIFVLPTTAVLIVLLIWKSIFIFINLDLLVSTYPNRTYGHSLGSFPDSPESYSIKFDIVDTAPNVITSKIVSTLENHGYHIFKFYPRPGLTGFDDNGYIRLDTLTVGNSVSYSFGSTVIRQVSVQITRLSNGYQGQILKQ